MAFFHTSQKNHQQRWLGLVLALLGMMSGIPAATYSRNRPATSQSAQGVKTLPSTAPQISPSTRPRLARSAGVGVTENYGKLPLSFEGNRGQTDLQVKYRAHGNAYNLFLTSAGAALELRIADCGLRIEGQAASLAKSINPHAALTGQKSATLQLRLVGANSKSRFTGLGQLPGRSNYFLGSDPKKWRTAVPNYRKVISRDVYPGIDLVYYGDQRQLEYDFVVAPSADPKIIILEFGGAERIALDAAGDLLLQIPGGQVVQRRPSVYQQMNGERLRVDGRYVLKSNNQVAFEIGAYDATKPLVIDPVLVFSTYLGGNNADQGFSVAVDPSGRAYVVGRTNSLDFPQAAGVQATNAGGSDVFVARLNATGTALEYATYLGGINEDEGLRIAIDGAGNAYVTGSTNSPNFPLTPNALGPSLAGGTDAFVAKLNSSGSGLVYSTYLGGTNNDEGYGIALDAASNAYIVGVTDSANFPTVNAYQTTNGGGSDAFLSKLNVSGSALFYSTYLGGNDTDWGFALSVDSGGNAYLTGITNSTNFHPTTNILQATLAGTADGFVTKVNTGASGPASLSYSTYLGGSGLDGCFGITTDPTGNAYVSGITLSSNFPVTTGALQTSIGGTSDAFITKLNPTGAGLIYSTYVGGGGADLGYGITLDLAGNVYITGSTESADFPVTPGAFQGVLAGSSDAFVTKLNHAGAVLVYASYLGGTASENGFGIALDSASNAFVTGATFSTNFPIVTGSLQPNLRGNVDAFVAKVSTPGSIQLLLEDPGPTSTQTAVLDSLLFLRDPLPVVNAANVLSTGPDRNTRVIVFVANLLLPPGEPSSSVRISLVDSNNQNHDIAAEDVRPVPNFPFTQVIFRLPDNLPAGTCTIRVSAQGQVTNSGTIRIRI